MIAMNVLFAAFTVILLQFVLVNGGRGCVETHMENKDFGRLVAVVRLTGGAVVPTSFPLQHYHTTKYRYCMFTTIMSAFNSKRTSPEWLGNNKSCLHTNQYTCLILNPMDSFMLLTISVLRCIEHMQLKLYNAFCHRVLQSALLLSLRYRRRRRSRFCRRALFAVFVMWCKDYYCCCHVEEYITRMHHDYSLSTVVDLCKVNKNNNVLVSTTITKIWNRAMICSDFQLLFGPGYSSDTSGDGPGIELSNSMKCKYAYLGCTWPNFSMIKRDISMSSFKFQRSGHCSQCPYKPSKEAKPSSSGSSAGGSGSSTSNRRRNSISLEDQQQIHEEEQLLFTEDQQQYSSSSGTYNSSSGAGGAGRFTRASSNQSRITTTNNIMSEQHVHFDDNVHFYDENEDDNNYDERDDAAAVERNDNEGGVRSVASILQGAIPCPSNTGFDHQQKILEEYFKSKNPKYAFKTRASAGYSSGSRFLEEDQIDLLFWSEGEGGGEMSNTTGDKLLKTINRILERHCLQQCLHFPTRWKYLKEKVCKGAEDLHSCKQFNIQVEQEEWANQSGAPTTDAIGTCLDVIELLAESALDWDPTTFRVTRTLQEKNEPNKYSSFFTGEVAKHVCSVIEELNSKIKNAGDSANTSLWHDDRPILHVPLFLALSQDDTDITKKSNRSACPILLDILNFCDKEDDAGRCNDNDKVMNMIEDDADEDIGDIHEDDGLFLIGFQPNFPHEKAQLQSDLRGRGLTHEEVIKERIQRSKRYIRFRTIEEVIQPLRSVQRSGVKLQIGRGEKALIVIVHPIITLIPGDNKEQNDQASVSLLMKGRKCRCCDEVDCIRFTPGSKTWQYRDDTRMQELVVGMAKIELKVLHKLYQTGGKRKKKDWLTQEEEATVTEATEWNLIPGLCTVYFDIAKEVKDIWGLPDWFGSHCLFPPDELHTLLKGPLENCLAWTMDTLYTLKKINKDEYKFIISEIDECFKEFPYTQAVTPVPLTAKKEGISKIFSEARSSKMKATQGTGMGTGGTPASHLAGMAFVLLYAIGEKGGYVQNGIIPSAIKLPHTHHYANPANGPGKNWNIKKIIVNAIQGVLNVVTFSRKNEGFTEIELMHLNKLIELSRAHMVQLNALRSDLKQMYQRKSISERSKKGFKGIKHHMLEHLTDFIKWFGIKRIWDTQRTERFHVRVKNIFRRTSQRKTSAFQEIGVRIGRVRRLKFLSKAIQAKAREQDNIAKVMDEISTLQQHKETIKTALETKQQQLRDLEQVHPNREQRRLLHDNNISKEDDEEENGVDDNILFNDELESSGNSMYETFFIPGNARKQRIAVNKQSIRENYDNQNLTVGAFNFPATTDLQHDAKKFILPYLDDKQLFVYCNNKTPEGRSKLLFDKHKEHPDMVHITLNSMLSSRGKPEIGIQPFTIRAYDNQFSALEVNAVVDDETQQRGIIVVRVAAILSLQDVERGPHHGRGKRQRIQQPEHNQRTILVCYLLEKDRTRREWDASNVLKYTRKNGMLDTIVIDLTSVVRPACLIPQLTKHFHRSFKESWVHQMRNCYENPKERLFHHIQIPTMHYINVVDWIQEQEQLRGTSTTNTSSSSSSNIASNRHVHHSLYLTEEELSKTQAAFLPSRDMNAIDFEDILNVERNIDDYEDDGDYDDDESSEGGD